MEQATALGILKTGRNVYLTGAAGSGKTHVLREYIQYLKGYRVGIGVTASTGIAATHLHGLTIHSWSGVGIKDSLNEWDIDALSQRQSLVKRFERTDVLIIDEVSMLRPEILDMVDQIARTLKRDPRPFGGMQVVLSGDFFQLPPVVRNGAEEAFVDSAQSWYQGDFRVCYLTEQFRHEDNTLVEVLNDIRDGAVTERSRNALQSRCVGEDEHDENAVVLYTHNVDVDARNARELESLDGDTAEYEMATTGRSRVAESLKKSVLAPETLVLKEGAKVMFVKNNAERGYVNGTMGVVTSLEGPYPEVETLDGQHIVAYPETWEAVDDGKVLASVSQVPLRLAWAITVHKSQGMSLDRVEIDLSKAFTPGQGYVALSRARRLDGLTLHGFNTQSLAVHPYVQALDEQLQESSAHWESVFARFSQQKVEEMQKAFITSVQRTEQEHAQKTQDSTPSHRVTCALAREGMTLAEIASQRALTHTTVIQHFEKIKVDEENTDALVHLAPACVYEDEALIEAFRVSKDGKLAPIYKKLKGVYTYDELRIARLFLY